MYSQVYQDEIAQKLIGDTGFYVDIGAGNGFNDPNGGNSLLLEEIGWNGILIEGCPARSSHSKMYRKGISICAQIPDIKIIDILDQNNCPSIIDYLSIDIEPVTLLGLKEFPLSKYRFKLLTFEHDLYANPEENIKNKNESFDILTSYGYHRFAEDVAIPTSETDFFEDWWVDLNFFPSDFATKNSFNKKTGLHILNNLR
jgi:hypothetical protein